MLLLNLSTHRTIGPRNIRDLCDTGGQSDTIFDTVTPEDIIPEGYLTELDEDDLSDERDRAVNSIEAEYLGDVKGLDNCTPDELEELAKYYRRHLRGLLTGLRHAADSFARGALTSDGAPDLLASTRERARWLKETCSLLSQSAYIPDAYWPDFAKIAQDVPLIIAMSGEEAMAAHAAREARWRARHEERKAAEELVHGMVRALRPMFDEIGLHLERSYHTGPDPDCYFLRRESGTRKSKVMTLAELVTLYLPGVDYDSLEPVPVTPLSPEEQAERHREMQDTSQRLAAAQAKEEADRARAKELKHRFREIGLTLTRSRGHDLKYFVKCRQTGQRKSKSMPLDELEAMYLKRQAGIDGEGPL